MDDIRIVCADDTDIALTGMVRILSSIPGFTVVESLQELEHVHQFLLDNEVDVIVLDLKWGDDFKAGNDEIPRIRSVAPQVKIVVISAFPSLAQEAVALGADVVLSKDVKKNVLADAIRKAVQIPADLAFAKEQFRVLSNIIPGERKQFRAHEACIKNLLEVLLSSDLSSWQDQVRNEEGTQIVDIIASNYSDDPFWSAMRDLHQAHQIIFELKNVRELSNTHINQVALQLGEPRGKLGFLIGRSAPTEMRRSAASVAHTRDDKVILLMCDEDFGQMIQLKQNGMSPSIHIRFLYESFIRKL